MVAALTRLFGARHLELAEDVVQEALLKAMHEWPFSGVPERPAAWLHRVARNLAIDHLRRHARGLELLTENAPLLRSEWTLAGTVQDALSEATIADDQLRMMFACCHPSLPEEQQVALALKTLCGFGVPEIARAFVTNEETINKRLYRAREAFRTIGRLEIPGGDALLPRLEHVLSTIYLLFNEGYNATGHRDLIREDLIEEAIRSADLLTQHERTDLPPVHALLALMLYHAARSAGRTDEHGAIVRLADQDRSTWDTSLIALANAHLDRAVQDGHPSVYALEAAIAAMHANAPHHDRTDWTGILRLYDRLLALKPTPIVALNRAIALAEVEGPAEALRAVDALCGLDHVHLYHAVRGDLLRRTGNDAAANAAFMRAIDLVRSPAERALLEKRLQEGP